MDLGKGSALPGRLGRMLLLGAITALVCSLLAALLISRTSMKEAYIPVLSAVALTLTSFYGALALGVKGKGRRRLICGLLYASVLSVIVLMLGFLIASDQMHARGLLRVLACCYVGGVFGAILGSREKTAPHKSRFAFANKKR